MHSETLSEVMQCRKVSCQYGQLVFPVVATIAPDTLRAELNFAQAFLPYDISVEAIRENMVYPVLREAWKQFIDTYAFWVGVELNKVIIGKAADYVFAKRSRLGKVVFDTPHVMVAETQFKTDHDPWAACLRNMINMQEANGQRLPVFGMVTDGQTWQFGQLENRTLTLQTDLFDRNKLNELFTALTYVLETCKRIYNL